MRPVVNLFWFRRDLRLHDNAGLYFALKETNPLVPVFLFDRNILDELIVDSRGVNKTDRRVEFIPHALEEMQAELNKIGVKMDDRYGFPANIFNDLLKEYQVEKVFTNHDYEPYALERDSTIKNLLAHSGVSLHTYKDQVIFEKNEVIKDDWNPYTVFTPYGKKWRSIANDFYLKSYPTKKYFYNFYKQAKKEIPSLQLMGFTCAEKSFPAKACEDEIIRNYSEHRDIPSIKGTSRLSVHLRFGTISIRELARKASTLNATFLNELIWRDFFQAILWHFPKVVTRSFRREYDNIKWRNNENEFAAWCAGKTGYPIVDAGMRELNETGYMHNRLRMITASFLTKHLLIDWRWGEAYFARKLLDFDLAANNGGWQWASGSGCDAVPYFRIFNPSLQTKKFDPELKYTRKWVPEFEELIYPTPIIEHEAARKRCLTVYSAALKK